MLICRDQRNGTGCGAQNADEAKICVQCGRSLRYALALRNIGEKVGSFRIVRLIGHGGFGAVYEVEVIQRPAVHVTLKETFDTESIRVFQREFEVLRQLQHDNLPRYFQVFESGGSGFLVMELVPGQSLDDILRKQPGPVLEKLALQYADQLCDVLNYLHSQNPPIIHRDIKPANIRLTPEGLIKLVDFGLLKQGTETTRTNRQRAGTLSYAPLEQWIGGTDQRSDIYGLGATLYHLATGQAPPPAAARSSGTDTLVAPRDLNQRISAMFSEAITTAMHMEREQRFPNVAAFHQELMRAAQMARGTTPLGNHAPTPPPARVRPVVQQVERPAQPTLVPPAGVPYPTRIESHHSWVAHYDTINTLAWNPAGTTLLSSGDDGRVRLWTFNDKQLPEPGQAILSGVGRVFVVTHHPNGELISSAGKDQVIRQWRASDGSWMGSWDGHVGNVYALAWSPDGELLISGSEDRTLRVWRTDGKQVSLLSGHAQAINGVAWHPNGRNFISASTDTSIRLWQTSNWSLVTTLRGHTRAVTCAAYSPTGNLIASGSADATIRLWQGADGVPSAILYGHSDAVHTLAWSPNGQLLATAGVDKVVRLWRVSDSALLETLEGHARPVHTLAWSPSGTFLASAGADRSVRLWRVE
jgi:eukaryotic-like serine/threonine-protein kinase